MANGRRNGERVLGSGHLIGLFLGVVLLCCVFYTLGYVMGRSQETSTVRAAAVDDSGTMTPPVPSSSGSIAASDNAGDQPAAAAASPSGASATPTGNDEWDSLSKKTGESPVERSVPPPPASLSTGNYRGGAVKEVGPSDPDENLSKPSPTAPPITATPATMVRTPVSSVTTEASGRVALPPNYQPPRIPHGAVLLQVAAVTSESDALALASVLHKKQFPAFVLTPTSDQFYRVQVGPYSDAHAAKAVRTMLDQAGFKSIIKR